MPARVAWISTTPVKGLAMQARDVVMLTAAGVVENRRFYLVDERAALVNGKHLGSLTLVRADYDAREERLALDFPDGSRVAGDAEPPAGASTVTTLFGRRIVTGNLLGEPFDTALSVYVGRALRLLRAEHDGAGVDRGPRAAVSLIGDASLARLGGELGLGGAPDARRFRMLFGIAGIGAHEEDGWLGRPVTLGEAVVRPGGLVGRCVVTTRSPLTGEADLDTLAALRRYRPAGPGAPPLGIHGEVLVPGEVRVGDVVEPR